MSDLHDDPRVMFRGDLAFLSNFYPCKVVYKGRTYWNSEAAFQAQKCLTLTEAQQAEFEGATAAEAKRLGRIYPLRPDWESVKNGEMYRILEAKFWGNVELLDALEATKDLHLEETNCWGDRYWGTVDGVGQNILGHLLMSIRWGIGKNTANGKRWQPGTRIPEGEQLPEGACPSCRFYHA